MAAGSITERYEQYLAMLGISHDAPWLHPPVSDAEVGFVEDALGFSLPDDLLELLQIHNGVRLFDDFDWVPPIASTDTGLLATRASLTDLVFEFVAAGHPLDLVPGPRTLWVGYLELRGILYDLDEQPGRLLWMDVFGPMFGQQAVVPLLQNLSTLVDIYLSFAEAGHITVDPQYGPSLTGPDDEILGIYLEHASLEP